MRVVRTNLGFTVVYNVIGIALAAMGILPPILAAAVRSLPDLGIMANSARLLRQPAPHMEGLLVVSHVDQCSRRSPLSRRRFVHTLLPGTTGVTLSGCGGSQHGLPAQPTVPDGGEASTDFASRFADFVPSDEPNGDLDKVIWPEWMARIDPEIKELYTFQILNGSLMRYMPCFCGCHWEDGHQNNRDCYIDTVNPAGSVIFHSMAPT